MEAGAGRGGAGREGAGRGGTGRGAAGCGGAGGSGTLRRAAAAAAAVAGGQRARGRYARVPAIGGAGHLGGGAVAAIPAAPALAGLLAPCLEPSAAFSAATVFAVAVYTAAVAKPRWQTVRGLFLASPALYTAGVLLAAAVAATSGTSLLWVWPLLQQGLAPSLASICAALSDAPLVACVWVQLLLMDMVMARQVHADGLRNGIPTPHSLILCFMVGPLGILSHLLTSKLWRRRNCA